MSDASEASFGPEAGEPCKASRMNDFLAVMSRLGKVSERRVTTRLVSAVTSLGGGSDDVKRLQLRFEKLTQSFSSGSAGHGKHRHADPSNRHNWWRSLA